MRSKSVIYAVCVLGALAAAACGSEDDSTLPGASGASGVSGTGGKGNAGSAGKAGSASGGKSSAGSGTGGSTNNGGDSNGMSGEGGEAGIGANPGCTDFSALVHDVIKNDTNSKSVPRPVNGVVFCPDPANPAAYDDLF